MGVAPECILLTKQNNAEPYLYLYLFMIFLVNHFLHLYWIILCMTLRHIIYMTLRQVIHMTLRQVIHMTLRQAIHMTLRRLIFMTLRQRCLAQCDRSMFVYGKNPSCVHLTGVHVMAPSHLPVSHEITNVQRGHCISQNKVK